MDNKEYIRKCDRDFRERLYDIADEVSDSFDREEGIRLISLSGPTCSGKTTASAMLGERLGQKGRHIRVISIDDFFFDRDYLEEISREEGYDHIDYDSERTIDLLALDKFINEVLVGEEVHCPIFDFVSGCRDGYRLVEADKDDIFVFEGIQAVYPSVVKLLKPHGYISIYITPMTPITAGGETFMPDEIRLMRRIVRDVQHRGTEAEKTIMLWDGVRANEEKNIFPYVDGCMYRIDSTHAYEIGVLKPYLESALEKIKENSPYYSTATAIIEKIKNIQPIDAALIDDNSLYREFV